MPEKYKIKDIRMSEKYKIKDIRMSEKYKIKDIRMSEKYKIKYQNVGKIQNKNRRKRYNTQIHNRLE